MSRIQNILFDKKLIFDYNNTDKTDKIDKTDKTDKPDKSEKDERIEKIFFTDIKYCQKSLPDQFISRNINLYEIKPDTKLDIFTDTMNNCIKPKVEESKDLNTKYRKLLLDQHKPGESENETIDTLILNIENEINDLDKNIQNTVKKLIFFKNLSRTKINYSIDYNVNKSYRSETVETLNLVNEILKKFTLDKYTEKYL
jgi:hypothetical protein